MAVSNPDIVIPDSPKQNVSITFKRKPNIDTTDFSKYRSRYILLFGGKWKGSATFLFSKVPIEK